MKNRVILASKSPRRQELLSKVVEYFSVIVSDVDEGIENEKPMDVPVVLAKRKADNVFLKNKDAIVIGADTVVILDDIIMGKPHSKEEAFDMLKNLSGKTHKVVTGCAIVSSKKEECFSVVTDVKFNVLSDEEIYDYIDTGEPFDKAGAYGIQGKGYFLVNSISGDYNNVVGLPISMLYRKLKEFN